MAIATLIDPAIVWESIDARTTRAGFSHAGRTVRAELSYARIEQAFDDIQCNVAHALSAAAREDRSLLS